MSNRKQPVDPVLTNVVQGYTNGQFIGEMLFPVIPVGTAAGQIIEFDKSQFKLYQTERARGASTKRIESGFEGKPYVCENHALEGSVTEEDLRDVGLTAPNVSLGVEAAQDAAAGVALTLEVKQALVARDPASYNKNNVQVMSGTSKWTDPTSTPDVDIANAINRIRQRTGMKPNRFALSPSAFEALKVHPRIRQQLFITADGKVITEDMLASLFGIEKVVVGYAITYDETTDEMSDVWGNDAVLGYVPAKKDQRKKTPSFGYTYRVKGYPVMRKPYYDDNRDTWYFKGKDERVPNITCKDAGFLFKDVV